MIRPEFKVREFLPDDSEYILKTWSREIEESRPRFQDGHSAMPKRLFFEKYQKEVILPLMRRSVARIVVPVNDVTTIAHFSVANIIHPASTSIVHFAYTRAPFRRLGLAKAALEAMGHQEGYEIVATHWTHYMKRLKRPELILNEFVLYGVK